MRYWMATTILYLFSQSLAATVNLYQQPTESVSDCYQYYNKLENVIRKTAVGNAAAGRIKDFPYLRTNRFFTTYKNSALSEKEFHHWSTLLHEFALKALITEHQNIPKKHQVKLEKIKLIRCGKKLLNELQRNPLLKSQLLENLDYTTEYRFGQKVLGLYPLTALGVKAGIKNWQHNSREAFMTPTRPGKGMWTNFIPRQDTPWFAPYDIADLLYLSSQNPLGIPIPNQEALTRLLDTFAPVWRIDVTDRYDLPGIPNWQSNNEKAYIDISSYPATFRYTSYTFWQQHALLQLNYVLWFPKRPKTSLLDPLGGHMDGILWRVTLAPDGTPLIYDTIHTCGCYHMFFPSEKLDYKAPEHFYQEDAFVPEQAPILKPNERIVVHIESGDHAITSITVDSQSKGKPYESLPYDALFSMKLPNGQYKSLFQEDGLVAWTNRLETVFFWPMGIPSPGAMRQAGTHATAFVGERHFDDPSLFETNFVPISTK